MNVSDYIAKFLIEKGVEHIFGFQGGAILKILDTAVNTGKIKYIQNYHEQASAFCADAYSRIKGFGVAIGTSGPGATNLITGIANAHFDSIPCLFITGQDYLTNVIKPDGVRQNGFQDLDIVSIVKPITKYAVMLENPNDIKYELEKCYYYAMSGRKGSVVIDIPIDIQFKEINEASLKSFEIKEEVNNFEYDKVEEVISLIKNAKRPVAISGGGIRIAEAVDEFNEFISKTNIPVVSTLNGLDVCGGNFSFAGLHGNTYSNTIVKSADLILAFGTRLGQRQVGKKPNEYTNGKVIHIDVDKNELSRAVKNSYNVYADVKEFLSLMNEKISVDFTKWKNQCVSIKEKLYQNSEVNKNFVDPVKFVRDLNKYLPKNCVLTADVGQNEMWAAQGLELNGKQRFLMSSGLGSMGYSLPAGIGASYADDVLVVSFTGDGGLQMNLQELHTLNVLKRNVKCVVFNNNTLGMMREVQARYYNANHIGANEAEFTCPNLKALASVFNLDYVEINSNDEVLKLKEVFETNTPCLIDVKVQFDSLLINRYDESKLIEENIVHD